MADNILLLPIDIPWKLIDVSKDMMDTQFCNKMFPAPWRSSLAIYAYEPSPDELPPAYANERITYLKVTCSITGYQPTMDEINPTGVTSIDLSDIPVQDLESLFDKYWACYGALLNVAVFPNPLTDATQLSSYPHIVDFEPKNRELIQGATETGEILTSSSNKVSTGKSHSRSSSTENGWNIAGELSTAPKRDEGGASAKISGSIEHKNTDTTNDTQTIDAEALRENDQKKSTETTISQLYNLLTGYHTGTNRATFLMLARPHTLQPTDKRTFIQGLRGIEGIQDFFLIVSRPSTVMQLSIEACLETGHFPEDVEITVPEQRFDQKQMLIDIDESVNFETHHALIRLPNTRGESDINITRSGFENDGWTFDQEAGDEGKQGVQFVRNLDGDNTNELTGSWASGELPAMENFDFGVAGADTIFIKAHLRSQFGNATRFHKQFAIHLKKPSLIESENNADINSLLITKRCLCATISVTESNPPLLVLVIPPVLNILPSYPIITGERVINIPEPVIRNAYLGNSEPAIKNLLSQIRYKLSTNWRSASQMDVEAGKFVNTEYFINKIKKVLPKDKLEKTVHSVDGLSPKVYQNLAKDFKVKDMLNISLSAFAKTLEVSNSEAIKIRSQILGFSTASSKM